MEMQDVKIQTLEELLQNSSASEEFKQDALEAQRQGRSTARVKFSSGNPPVKVVRVLCGLLEKFSGLPIEQVEVRGQSGCSDYRGELILNGGEKRFNFVWDCAWKASQMGWKDMFGDPDQIRAARAFQYRCFEKFEEI